MFWMIRKAIAKGDDDIWFCHILPFKIYAANLAFFKHTNTNQMSFSGRHSEKFVFPAKGFYSWISL